MPEQFTGSTFNEVYRDDFADSAGYHKVLFNSGRPLQARELTQLQTILQEQITRFASNIFQDGAAVSTNSAGTQTAVVDYVIVNELVLPPEDYIGVIFQGPAVAGITGGLQFQVTHVLEATAGEDPVLYGRYVSANQGTISNDVQSSQLFFSDGQTLTDIRTIDSVDGTVGTLVVRTRPSSSQLQSVGKGLRFGMQNSEFFAQGHFVTAPTQSIIIGKYDNAPGLVEVGFEVVQDIVTVADDEALYDNQGARPNLSSPGADRYRIRLLLTTKESVANTFDFLPFATVRNGVIIAKKGETDGFNSIEKRMATRSKETSGNFVASDFLIRYEEGGDSNQFEFEVPEKVNGSSPTVYVDGFRLIHEVPYTQSIDKPLDADSAVGVVSSVEYKNYVRVAGPGIGGTGFGAYVGTNVAENEKHVLYNQNGGTVLGSARIKSFKQIGIDSDYARAYLFDVQMEPGQNFRDVRSIAPISSGATGGAGDGFRPVLEDNQLFVEEANTNDSLFLVPGGRVKAVSNAVFTVQRSVTEIATSSTINLSVTGVGETFDDEGQWIVHNLTTNQPDEGHTVALDPNNPTLANITVTGADGEYFVTYYVQKATTQAKIKTYTEDFVQFDRVGTTDEFKPAVNLYDGVRLIEAYAGTDSSGTDLFNALEFDGGQRDNYYGPTALRGRTAASVSTVYAKVAYFEWSAGGDYFSVESYTNASQNENFTYADIPSYQVRSDGEIKELHNYFDFRNKLDPTQDTMPASDHFDLPRDADTITYNVEWWKPRVDIFQIGYDKNFRPVFNYKYGTPAMDPKTPPADKGNLALYSIYLGGNTKNTEDMTIRKHSYPRYRMTEINELEERIARLEETVSLTLLESEAMNHTEFDSDGAVRSTTGFFADDFTGSYRFQASQFTPDFVDMEEFIMSSWDADRNVMYPKQAISETNLFLDTDNLPNSRARSGKEKSNVVVRGDMLMLEYTDVLDPTLVQEVISWKSDGNSNEHGYYNVNPFNVFTGEGNLKIRPSRDQWVDTRRVPDNIVNGGTVNKISNPGFVPRTFTANRWVTRFGTATDKWGNTRTTWWSFRTSERVTPRVRTRVISDEQVMTDLGDSRVGLKVIPFCRQKRILGSAEGLRPNTRYWLYFDGVDVSQWTLSVASLTEYNSLFSSGVTSKNYASVQLVNDQHPETSGLTTNVLNTDANGRLYFDFWLPNNAPVPIGANFTAIKEWENYIDEQRRLARIYGSHKNKNVFNQLGWKFRSGTRPMTLLDVSDFAEENALSRARTTFTAAGELNVVQRNILSTRVITSEQFQVAPVDPPGWSDPLAQSFMVDANSGVPGVFVTKVDVFIRRAPKTKTNGGSEAAIPLQLQIRAVENGTPVSGIVSEQHRSYKTADEVYQVVNNISSLTNLEDVLENPVTFTFDEPIFLQSGFEYALVLLAECDGYEAFVASTYDLILGLTNKRVSKQPAGGSLFLSQNGSTWTPKQNQDLAYRIYTAKFKEEGSANFLNSEVAKHAHNYNTSLSADSDDLNRFFVTHPAHGLGVGDTVDLTGLEDATLYGGVEGSVIMNSNNIVDSADVSGYYVKLPVGESFDVGTNVFGDVAVETNQGFNIDGMVMALNTIPLAETTIDFTGSLITGLSYADAGLTGAQDPRFDVINQPIVNRRYTRFAAPRYLGNSSIEADNIGGQKSVVIGAQFNTNQQSTFGGQLAAAASSLGYVSDVTPLIDMQSMSLSMDNNIIDNQPLDSDNTAGRINTNAPVGYVPETHPTQGTSPSKIITKVISLDTPANSVRVFLNANRPPAAGIDLYFRSGVNADEDLYTKEWVYIPGENNPKANDEKTPAQEEEFYSEYRYLIGGIAGTELPDFATFQLKVVMRSRNTSQEPSISGIRAIAIV